MKNFILLLEKFCNGFIHMMVNNAEVWQTLNFDPNIYQNFRHEHRINLFFTVKIRLIKDCILIKDLPGQHLILSMLGIIFDNLTHIIHHCFHSILVVWFDYCLNCLTLGRSLHYTILGVQYNSYKNHSYYRFRRARGITSEGGTEAETEGEEETE